MNGRPPRRAHRKQWGNGVCEIAFDLGFGGDARVRGFRGSCFFLFCKIQFFGTMHWAKCVVVIYSNFGRGRKKKLRGGVKTKVGLTKKERTFLLPPPPLLVK